MTIQINQNIFSVIETLRAFNDHIEEVQNLELEEHTQHSNSKISNHNYQLSRKFCQYYMQLLQKRDTKHVYQAIYWVSSWGQILLQ